MCVFQLKLSLLNTSFSTHKKKEMDNMTMIGDEEGAKAVMDAIQEPMDNMTDEDWDRVIEDLRNRTRI